MRKEFQLSDLELKDLLDACKPVRYMVFGGHSPRSPQENANAAWRSVGEKLGFDYLTVKPIVGKGQQFFTAEEKEVRK